MDRVSFKDLGLDEKILESIEKLGYTLPTEVQAKVLPFVFENQDVIVKSQTGSGKTAAFGIPICERVEIENRGPQALVLTPTRELALQVKEELTNIGRYKAIRCAAIFGKQPILVQVRELKQRVHVVVGTPGRVFDHIQRGTLDLSSIKYLIIDEADKMLNMGFIEQVEAIIKVLPSERVSMLFSATLPSEIEVLCDQYMHVPKKIEIEHKNKTAESISQYYYMIEDNNKYKLLIKTIYQENPDSAVIFANTKESVGNLYNNMKKDGFSCECLHGGMEQKDRLEAMKSFKRGDFRFLVATDVAARGIHVEEVTHVFNYDIPPELEGYIHRIGRTGRAGNKGVAITFVTPYQVNYLKQLEEYIGYDLIKKEIPDDEESNKHKEIYNKTVRSENKPKVDKGAKLNKDIMKIYINAGKKKKIRPTDIVGAISNIEGVEKEDIGIIDIQDNVSYIDILGNKGNLVIRELEKASIKGKKVRVQKAKNQD